MKNRLIISIYNFMGMKMAYERNYDLLNRKFRELLIPTISTSIAGNLAILIDAFLISFILDASYLSVVQCVEPFAILMTVLYWMFALGGSVLCSIAKADFDDRQGNELFTVSIISIIIISSAITIFALLFSDSIVTTLCFSDSLRPFVEQYFVLFLIGMPFLSYMVVMAYFIKSFGFLKFQFWVYLSSNIINVICDVLFMKYFNMGIAGAGLATTVAFVISALIISYYFLTPEKPLKIVKIKISTMLRYIVRICKSGMPVASTQLYATIKLFLINALLLFIIGEIGLASYNMCCNVLFLVTIFVVGILQTILPIVSVYYKEEDYNGVDYVTYKSLKIIICLGIIFSLLFIIFPKIILFLFNVNNASDIPIVMNAIRLFSFCFVGYGICNLYVFYAQSVQYNKLANGISLVEGLILPVVFAYLLGYIWGENGVWIAFPIAEFLAVLLIVIYSKYISKKTNNEYSGFFLNKTPMDDQVYEFTLTGTKEDVGQLSGNIQEYLSESESGMKVCLAIEEMLTHIINLNDEVDLIDIIIRDKKDEVLISIKYSGIPCNPTEKDNLKTSDIEGLEDIINSIDYSKIDDLNEIADNIEYSQILELNNVCITIKY